MATINSFYKKFPSRKDCIKHLEQNMWSDGPQCPYCSSKRHSAMSREDRYHCNECNRSYSITVNAIFHKSKIDLQKWFYTFFLIMHTEENITARQLAATIHVTKDSAWFMLQRIKTAIEDGFTI